ncbi:MAG: hypothetical protein Q7S86_04770 [bacterium]|nr:hypothetical protein [bacterium]
MKKFYPKILLFTLLLAVVFSPLFGTYKAEAQALEPLTGAPVTGLDLGDPFAGPSTVPANYVEQNPAQIPANTVTQGSNSPGAGVANDAAKRETPKPPLNASCVDLSAPFFHLDACAALVINFIMWVISWFLYLAGFIFDQSMQFTLNISELMKSIPVVDIGWKIFRDLANVFFIFILLWIAMSTILGFNSGKTKELIVHLVVVALLMNFSLFITKTIIDGSNIIALHFYNLIVNSQTTGANQIMTPQGSMSGAFMEGLKIQTLYDSRAIGEPGQERAGWGTRLKNAAINTVAGTITGSPVAGVVAGVATLAGGNVINWGKIILIGIFGSALMLIAAYVFLVGAVLMLIRAIVLMFVMMLSPLAFLAFAMPFAEKFVEPWREALIKQCIFAPAFMTLSYVVVKTIQSPAFKGVTSITMGEASLATAFTTGAGEGITLIINFLLIIGLMIGCILVAKKLEVHGLEFAKTVGAKGAMWVASGRFITTTAGVAAYGFKGVSRSMQSFQQIGGGAEKFYDKLKGGVKGGLSDMRNHPEGFVAGAKEKGMAGLKAGLTGAQNLGARGLTGAKNMGLRGAEGIGKVLGTAEFERNKVISQAFGGTPEEQKALLKKLDSQTRSRRWAETAKGAEAFGDYLNTGAGKLAKEVNAVELKRRFDSSAIGKTALGAFLSDQTFGRLLHAKFGGEESLEEAHHKDEDQESREFDVDRQIEAVKAAKETRRLKEEMKKLRTDLKALKKARDDDPTNTAKARAYDTGKADLDVKSKEHLGEVHNLERALNRQSNKGFLAMPKDLYQDPEIMRHISVEKIQALMKDDHTLDNEQKEEAMAARWEEPKEKFNEYQKAYEEWDKKMLAHKQRFQKYYAGEAPGDEAAAKAEAATFEEGGVNSQPQLDQATRRMVRNIRNPAEFEMLNTYFPQMFKNEKFVERILQGSIDRIRESNFFTSQEKEDNREAKSHGVWNAAKSVLGLDPVELNKMSKAAAGALVKAANARVDQIGIKAYVAELRAQDAANVDGRNNRFALHLKGRDDMVDALKEKTHEEISKMPGRILLDNFAVVDTIDSGRGYALKGKDEGDKIPVIKGMIERFNRGDISKDNEDFLRSMVRYKEWQSFTNLESVVRGSKELKEGLDKIKAKWAINDSSLLPEDPTLLAEVKARWAKEKEDAKSKPASGTATP